MPGPVTLLTGQWADQPFEVMTEKAAEFGYDGPLSPSTPPSRPIDDGSQPSRTGADNG